jgi:hypothetical protein
MEWIRTETALPEINNSSASGGYRVVLGWQPVARHGWHAPPETGALGLYIFRQTWSVDSLKGERRLVCKWSQEGLFEVEPPEQWAYISLPNSNQEVKQ